MDSNFLEIFEREVAGERKFTPFGNLEIGRKYKVLNFRFLEGVFGRQVVLDLDNLLWTALPKHTADLVTDQARLDVLNSRRYTLIYTGADPSRGSMMKFKLIPGETQ